MPTLKPSARNLDPCLADGRNPWNLVDPEPKSPSSRFLCQITACLPAPIHLCSAATALCTCLPSIWAATLLSPALGVAICCRPM